MFVIQTRNYILKCVNSLVLFTEMACDKKPPATRGASNPGLTEPASMFVIKCPDSNPEGGNVIFGDLASCY